MSFSLAANPKFVAAFEEEACLNFSVIPPLPSKVIFKLLAGIFAVAALYLWCPKMKVHVMVVSTRSKFTELNRDLLY